MSTDAKQGEEWVLLRVLPVPEEAAAVEDVLREKGVPCSVADREHEAPEALGEVATGLWVKVPRDRRAEAEGCLSAAEEDRIFAEAPAQCGSCGSREFCAAAPSQSPDGSWWLRCLNCGRTLPVSEGTYGKEEFLILPATCPECGSFRVTPADSPSEDFDLRWAEDRLWCACENCEHRWDVPFEAKGPGKAAPGTGPEYRTFDLAQVAVQEQADPTPCDSAAPSDDEEDAPAWPQCPRCRSREISMNDTLVEKGGPVRFLCTKCTEVWDEQIPAGVPLPDLPVLRDGDAADAPGRPCPQCGAVGAEPCGAPEFGGQSALAYLFTRLLGSETWRRCVRCGFQWQT